MKAREELTKAQEYWYKQMQTEIKQAVLDHLEKEGINQTQLSERLGFSRTYVSKILRGKFNYTLKQLIIFSYALNKAPVLEFKNLGEEKG
jgi:transcriptional regulator with XRE-family HTH domain